MKLEFKRTGAARKELVNAIAEITGMEAKYLKVPTCNYQIGNLIVDKNGTLEIPENIFPKDVRNLLIKLSEKGFTAENNEVYEENVGTTEQPEVKEESEEYEEYGLTISLPIEKVAVGNLTNLIEAKGDLIKKALGIEDARIELDEEKVTFPWFSEMPDAEKIDAYTNFIGKLGEFSKKRKRINATKKEVPNEKYAFRCFLLSLGFIGDEYKQDRKILLSNLEGSSAFKSGARKEAEHDEISE